MNLKKILIIICAVLFFLSALTSYINRILFPKLIKKITTEHIEETLGRKVEIDSMHFNWVKGFIIDKIKIYEKDSDQIVFAQADQVSFGILLFPGIKHYRITIPFINVRSPSVHLIRTADNTWNFSDMLPQPSTAASISPKTEKTPAFEIAWGGIAISNGKLLVNDTSKGRQWHEFLDNINLKLSLSYKGINYDFNADIPGKNGSLGATVYYQPITQNTQAQIRLKNIDTASYLSLIDLPDVHLDSGIIKDINLNITHTQDKTSAQGDIIMKGLDISNQDQSFKGDIEIQGLDAQYQNGNVSAHGQIVLNKIKTKLPDIAIGGSVEARVGDFELSQAGGGVTFIGSLRAQNTFITLKDRQVKVDDVNLENIKIRKDKDGIQSVGSIMTHGLFIQWPKQKLQGDINLKAVTMRMKDENNITLEGDIQADNFMTNLDDKILNSQHILLENVQMSIINQANIFLNTKLSMNDMRLILGKNTLTASSLQTEKFSFDLDNGMIEISSVLNSLDTKLFLDHHKTIEANPELELNLQMPLNNTQALTYKGSVTLSDGKIQGFSPLQSLDNVELDADFQNDEATINALSINILDTNVRMTGTVKNFKKPFINITADADELNLSKIKDLAPQVVSQYGLTFNGTSFVKVQFTGLLSDPLAAKILAVASFKNASIASSALHQKISNITGIIEATPDSLEWRDFTANYMGKKYNLAGHLNNFKNPQITATLSSKNLKLTADITKNDNILIINSLTGTYMKTTFNSTGNMTLLKNKEPEFDITANASSSLEDLIKNLPDQQRKAIEPLNPAGMLEMTSHLKGNSFNWKDFSLNTTISSPVISLMGYTLNDMKINIEENSGKIKNMTFDGKLYDGLVHAVGSVDLYSPGIPYDLAFNIDNTDLHKLKMDSPLKMQEINGKFYLTSIAHGTIADFKNNFHATGSFAIRDGFLAEFNLFKGLLSVLNDAMHLGQVMITDVEANFNIDNQRISTDNLRLKGPTIVLLGKGWINFDEMCDLDMTVDLSSGIVPDIAQDVLKTLNIRIYDKITNPKFKRRISVPQVINTLFKNLLQ